MTKTHWSREKEKEIRIRARSNFLRESLQLCDRLVSTTSTFIGFGSCKTRIGCKTETRILHSAVRPVNQTSLTFCFTAKTTQLVPLVDSFQIGHRQKALSVLTTISFSIPSYLARHTDYQLIGVENHCTLTKSGRLLDTAKTDSKRAVDSPLPENS